MFNYLCATKQAPFSKVVGVGLGCSDEGGVSFFFLFFFFGWGGWLIVGKKGEIYIKTKNPECQAHQFLFTH